MEGINAPRLADSAVSEVVGPSPDLTEIPKGAAVILSRFTLFSTQLSQYWRERGLDVVIISFDGGAKSGHLADGTYMLALNDYDPKWVKAIRYGPMTPLSRVEKGLFAESERAKQALEMDPYQPAARFVAFGFAVSLLVRRLRPSFVFAQQVVRFGFAAALCQPHFPTLAMPYGQDIYRLALSSPPHRLLARWALNRMDLILPASDSAVSHLVERFGVDRNKVRSLSWGVDTRLCHPPSPAEKTELRSKYGLPLDAFVVMNARRFDPGWGSKPVSEVFLELANLDSRYHFIVVGGTFAGSDEEIHRLRRKVEQSRLDNRFSIFENGVSLSTFVELLMASDVFTSLMLGSDMRSASILQGIAAGVAPVVTEWPEYRYMERLGFQALFVPMHDVDKAVEAVEFYRHNPEKMKETIEANLQYVVQHEDYDKQMELLLQTINEVVERRRRRS